MSNVVADWYEALAKIFSNVSDWTFMNYGFASPDDPTTDLQEHSLELYRQVVGSANLTGKSLLEIGCGRGGGIAFLRKTLDLSRCIGLDYSKAAVQFCKRNHAQQDLHFLAGDAQNLPFGSNSFDVVVNVESSHSYPEPVRFLQEVHRILKPNGLFLFADFRSSIQVPSLRSAFLGIGFGILEERNITEEVFHAMKINSDQKEASILTFVPEPLQFTFRHFAGVQGSPIFNSLQSGDKQYLRYVMEKVS